MNRIGLYERALEVYGTQHQCPQAIEELCEVVHQLSRMLQGDVGNLYHLAEEIADARIMLDQMELAFDLTEEIREWEERKLTRLQRMVEEHG